MKNLTLTQITGTLGYLITAWEQHFLDCEISLPVSEFQKNEWTYMLCLKMINCLHLCKLSLAHLRKLNRYWERELCSPRFSNSNLRFRVSGTKPWPCSSQRNMLCQERITLYVTMDCSKKLLSKPEQKLFRKHNGWHARRWSLPSSWSHTHMIWECPFFCKVEQCDGRLPFWIKWETIWLHFQTGDVKSTSSASYRFTTTVVDEYTT